MARPKTLKPEKQRKQPGQEYRMSQKPEVIHRHYRGSGKLNNKVALITGGDSGIGRAVSVHFAREGAQIAIVHLREDEDARETKRLVEAEGKQCLILKGNARDESFCRKAVNQVIKEFGGLNILVNNVAEQHPQDDYLDITSRQFEKTFQTNIFSFHYFTHQALKKMRKGDVIINTSSVTAFRGSEHLVDYSATKGAILSFTRSLAKQLAPKGIRVNAVAPGPIWTPLIVSSFKRKEIKEFGKKTPMQRAGQPSEVAPAYVFLASKDGSYITGQVIHPNGGEIVGA